MERGIELKNVRVALFDEVDAATLETTVNTFLSSFSDPTVAGQERVLVSVQYQVAVAESSTVVAPAGPVRTQTLSYSCMIVYME